MAVDSKDGKDGKDSEYRASSDVMMEMLRQLQHIEQVKREVTVGSERFIALAREAEDLRRNVFRWSQFQGRLAELSPEARARGELSGKPLEHVTARRIDRILADWREAELRFERAAPGSEAAAGAAADIERLREEYREMHERTAVS